MATTKKAASKSAHKVVEDASTLYVDKSKEEAKPATDPTAKAVSALEVAIEKAQKAGIAVAGSYAYENHDGSTNNGRFGK